MQPSTGCFFEFRALDSRFTRTSIYSHHFADLVAEFQASFFFVHQSSPMELVHEAICEDMTGPHLVSYIRDCDNVLQRVDKPSDNAQGYY
uniref:RGS domain-containing protein n=1 Tax=Mesocestoides corti TaxID=53468 RepID=A0A5K3ENZ4_MESCO